MSDPERREKYDEKLKNFREGSRKVQGSESVNAKHSDESTEKAGSETTPSVATPLNATDQNAQKVTVATAPLTASATEQKSFYSRNKNRVWVGVGVFAALVVICIRVCTNFFGLE